MLEWPRANRKKQQHRVLRALLSVWVYRHIKMVGPLWINTAFLRLRKWTQTQNPTKELLLYVKRSINKGLRKHALVQKH